MTSLVIEGPTLRRGRDVLLDWSGHPGIGIAPGELFAMVGKSGAGKTALARLIAGLEVPDEGRISNDDGSLAGLAPGERGVALIAEGDGIWPHWTVTQNVGFGLKCNGLMRGERRMRAEEVMNAFGLEGLANERAGKLSTPQRWRVVLARALALDPRLLVIDEPFAGMNATERLEVADLIRQVRREHGITTLVLTRDGPAAAALASRLAVISVGGPLQEGTPGEVYQRPASLEIAQMFGPITTFAGELVSLDPRGEAVVGTRVGKLVGTCRAEALPPGSTVVALARPESLILGSATSTGVNRFMATVSQRSFEAALCRVDLFGPADWHGHALTLRPAGTLLREGQTLAVSVAADALSIVPGGPRD